MMKGEVEANEVGLMTNEVEANEVEANEVEANEVGANEVGLMANEVGANEVEEDNTLYRLFLTRIGWPGVVNDTKGGLSLAATPLRELLPLDYGQVERLIFHLGLQMQVLQEHQKGICGFTLEDITVLDGEYFFLAGLQQVIHIKNSKNKEPLLAFTYPMKFTEEAKELLAPELREKLAAKVLPFKTSLSVGYYSLAKLCLVCLALTDNLEALRGSKMYYCFERCLRVEPAERSFLHF